VLCREAEVAELSKLLTADDRRPVLIVGPRLVGKTALLHEHVFHACGRREGKHRFDNNVWLVSPQRLISGMSFVGQWENRLLAILKEVKKRDHVLYFDDLLGLYQAGQSLDSKLCVADVLRPYVERAASAWSAR
jgi:ATP-dependent Clp protease ATP-binding subunit ClpA